MFTTSGLILGVVVLWFVLFLAFLIGESSCKVTTKEWLLIALIMSAISTAVITIMVFVYYKIATAIMIIF